MAYLIHKQAEGSSSQKGSQRSDHKYIRREGTSGNYVYIYKEDEASGKSAESKSTGTVKTSNTAKELIKKAQTHNKDRKESIVASIKSASGTKSTDSSNQSKVSAFASKLKSAMDSVSKTVNDTKEAVKKATDKDQNMYLDINSSNYQSKKSQIQSTDEWVNETKDPHSQYRKVDTNGNVSYDYDSYITDKKHPILDALTDYGNGRKVSITEQNVDTLTAGAKDYVVMGQKTAENILGLGVGLLRFKVKNNQGSYDDEWRKAEEFKDDVTTAASGVAGAASVAGKVASKNGNDYAQIAQDTYDLLKSDVPDEDKARGLATQAGKAAAKYTSDKYGVNTEAILEAAVTSYKNSHNVTTAEAEAYVSANADPLLEAYYASHGYK